MKRTLLFFIIACVIVAISLGIIIAVKKGYESTTVGYGRCYTYCSSILYDSGLSVNNKEDAKTVFGLYLEENFQNLTLSYNIPEEKNWVGKQNPDFEISKTYYELDANCSSFMDSLEHAANPKPIMRILENVCSTLVTGNGKICRVSRMDC